MGLLHIAVFFGFILLVTRPLGAYINEVQGYMSEEAKAAVRRKLRRDRVMAGWGMAIEPALPIRGNLPI